MCEGVLKWMNGEIKPSPPDRHRILHLPHSGRLVQMSSPLARTSPLTARPPRTLHCPPVGSADATANPRATQAGRLKTSHDRRSSLFKRRWRRLHEALRAKLSIRPRQRLNKASRWVNLLKVVCDEVSKRRTTHNAARLQEAC